MPSSTCLQKRRQPRSRRHHIRQRRMPTWGRHNSTITGSPLEKAIKTFSTAFAAPSTPDALDELSRSPGALPLMAESVTRHMQRLYNDLKGRHDDLLSRDKFDAFLRSTQRDLTLPSWTFSPKASHFSFQDFQHHWWYHYSAAKRPIHPQDKDLDHPISNYFISSSHNTYIEDGNQLTGEPKALQYAKVLESGCRCVEIDVWDASEPDDKSSSHRDASVSETSRSIGKSQARGSTSHWSFASMFSWMRDCCQDTPRTMSFPRNLRPKKSQASFKPKALPRARALSTTLSSELKHEPRVCHAMQTSVGDVTLHHSIPFRTVCQTIREHAFGHGNELPVIISLEVHANLQQQEKMVEIMKEEWGELLLSEPLPHRDPDKDQPTVRDLQNKILVKVKTAPTCPATKPLHLQNSSPPMKRFWAKSNPVSGGHHDIVDAEKPAAAATKPGSKRRIHDSLQKLAIYTFSPGHFESFDADDALRPGHIYSFGEEKIKALHRTEHDGLFRHNTRFLARTYPESLRSFLSSNPNYPTLFWREGVQMVALNWQVWDTAMELNSAMFDNEGGWVLKPPGYRINVLVDDGEPVMGAGLNQRPNPARQAPKKKLQLTITILAGQHLPTPDQDPEAVATRVNLAAVNSGDFRPRVTCFLHVGGEAASDKDEIVRKTRPARTEQPDWGVNGSRLNFPAVRNVVEDLTFVRFHVEHCRPGAWRDRTAWACIRLDRLQDGYRLVKLKDDDGYTTDGVLLVKVEKTLHDEKSSSSSRRARPARTWNACKGEVEQWRSKWFCMG